MVSMEERLSLQVLSFGFKYGLPFEADLVVDVRFLPNPYFVEHLKDLTGETEAVKQWVLQWPLSCEFIEDYSGLLLKLLPHYIEEGKRYLTICIGCTGGKHRSVVISEQVSQRLREHRYSVKLFHRDIRLE